MDLEYDSNDDNAGGYQLEEYSVGPTQQQQAAEEKSSIDFRMDAPPPSMSGGSMEQRFKAAGEMAPPEGMQLARPAPGCCAPDGGSSHTGPKAVKADYEAAKQIMRDKRMRANLERERMMQPQARVDIANLTMTAEEKAMLAKANKGSDEDSEDEDDAAFQKYKQERIAFVQNSLPRFGTHTRVSKLEFANLVKSVHELCYVVCHIYQNSIEACARLNLCLESLAPQFPHVRFVRLRSREAMGGFSNAGLPALLVYKGGKMVTSALRVGDVLPRAFGDVDVARLLQAKGILSVPTGLKDNSARLRAEREAGGSGRAWSDDENEAAAAENQSSAELSNGGGFNLLGDLTSAGMSSSSSAASSSGGKLRKSQFSRRRAGDSGSDSD